MKASSDLLARITREQIEELKLWRETYPRAAYNINEQAKAKVADSFYFSHGKCCAGCDWWRSLSSQVGDCTKAAPVDGHARWAMLGIDRCSLTPEPGHVVTARDHVCGDFKDEFDWTTLPLPYRKRIGEFGVSS